MVWTNITRGRYERIGGRYASDCSDVEWALIEPFMIWADGVRSGLRGEDDKLCALVIVGVTARGKKRFLAIEDGVRESTES